MNNNNTAVVLTATFEVKESCINEAKNLFTSIVGPSNEEDGCIVYELFQDKEQPNKFVFFEKWKTQQHLDKHVNAEHIANIKPTLEKIVAVPLKIQWLQAY